MYCKYVPPAGGENPRECYPLSENASAQSFKFRKFDGYGRNAPLQKSKKNTQTTKKSYEKERCCVENNTSRLFPIKRSKFKSKYIYDVAELTKYLKGVNNSKLSISL